MMFHQANNLFFGKKADGSIRILKFVSSPDVWPFADWVYSAQTVFDVSIPAAQWNNIQASLECGEEQIVDFHQGNL